MCESTLHHLVTYEQIFQIHLEYLLLSHQIDLNYAETVIEYNIFISNLSESNEYLIINNIVVTMEIIDDANTYIEIRIYMFVRYNYIRVLAIAELPHTCMLSCIV